MSDIKKRVVAIQGIPVSNTTPTTGQVLEYDGTEYVPSDISIGVAGGDLSGTYPDPTVVALTGNSGVVLVNAEVLQSTTAQIVGLTITTNASGGADNGPINIISGCGSSSTSGSAHNITLDSGSQNGAPQASIYLVTGYGNDNAQEIALDCINASLDPSVAQIGLTGKNIRFNTTGMSFSNILTVSSTYTVNNGRSNLYDYTVLGDTTSSAFTISLPPSPSQGDTYNLGDAGNAATNNLTISGNGSNIDGSSTAVISTNFECMTVVYTGSFWKVISRS